MAEFTIQGNPTHTAGDLPSVGDDAPDFTLVSGDWKEKSLGDYAGKNAVLNIFLSVDTGVCAASIRKFNQAAGARDDTAVLCISADLPFAASRFCGAEGIENVETLSSFRNPEFGKDYGVTMIDSHLAGTLARAVVIVGPDGKVTYTQLVPELGTEPDYDAALAAL